MRETGIVSKGLIGAFVVALVFLWAVPVTFFARGGDIPTAKHLLAEGFNRLLYKSFTDDTGERHFVRSIEWIEHSTVRIADDGAQTGKTMSRARVNYVIEPYPEMTKAALAQFLKSKAKQACNAIVSTMPSSVLTAQDVFRVDVSFSLKGFENRILYHDMIVPVVSGGCAPVLNNQEVAPRYDDLFGPYYIADLLILANERTQDRAARIEFGLVPSSNVANSEFDPLTACLAASDEGRFNPFKSEFLDNAGVKLSELNQSFLFIALMQKGQSELTYKVSLVDGECKEVLT